MRRDRGGEKKKRDGVKERREVWSWRRETVADIIELKRWSGAISKQVGVWSEKERARY